MPQDFFNRSKSLLHDGGGEVFNEHSPDLERDLSVGEIAFEVDGQEIKG